jgi:hypothetical protein
MIASEFEKLIAGSTTYDFTSLTKVKQLLSPSSVFDKYQTASNEKSFAVLKNIYSLLITLCFNVLKELEQSVGDEIWLVGL